MANKKKSTALTRASGGQPGNWNSFKHGFYSKRYLPLELSELDIALGDGLMDEIALLRVIIRRVFEFANDHETQDLDMWSRSLNTLGSASTRLAGLLRTHQIIGGGSGDDLEQLAAQFGVIAHDLGYTDPSRN